MSELRRVPSSSATNSVFVTEAKLAEVAVLLVPEIEDDEGTYTWSGTYILRTKNVPVTAEGKSFMIGLLQAAIEDIEASDE